MTYTISKDATYVPTTTTGTTGTANSMTKDAATITGNYSTFLSLLTAQVKNQDPLSPMDSTQWTNQLVQYSSVEQQLKGNTYLQQIAANNQAGSMNAAVSYIGKTVSADTDTATLKDGKAAWDYNLGATASKATLKVLDSQGSIVWSGDAPDATKGDHSFAWDGKDSNGKAVPAGNYTLSVTATTANGTNIDTGVSLSGAVTSAQTVDGVVMLDIGGTQVAMTKVTRVS